MVMSTKKTAETTPILLLLIESLDRELFVFDDLGGIVVAKMNDVGSAVLCFRGMNLIGIRESCNLECETDLGLAYLGDVVGYNETSYLPRPQFPERQVMT
jgi:hypothetical protein